MWGAARDVKLSYWWEGSEGYRDSLVLLGDGYESWARGWRVDVRPLRIYRHDSVRVSSALSDGTDVEDRLQAPRRRRSGAQIITLLFGDLAANQSGPVVGVCPIALVLVDPLGGDDFHPGFAPELGINASVPEELDLLRARRRGQLLVELKAVDVVEEPSVVVEEILPTAILFVLGHRACLKLGGNLQERLDSVRDAQVRAQLGAPLYVPDLALDGLAYKLHEFPWVLLARPRLPVQQRYVPVRAIALGSA